MAPSAKITIALVRSTGREYTLREPMGGRLAVVLLAAACSACPACGDNRDVCDYHEHADPGSVEVTGLAVGEHAINLCGTIDGGNRDPVTTEVDSDSYRVTVGGDGQLLVEITGDAELSVFDAVTVRVFDTGAAPRLLAQGELGYRVAEHGAFVATVPPGDVDIVVSARSQSDLIGSLAYRVRILADPGLACPALHGGPHSYSEADDGDAQTGNDVALADFTKDPAIVADPLGSNPEATHLTIVPGDPSTITGIAGSVGRGDAYLDRDTFAITTNEVANELAIRLDWLETTVDLDTMLLDPATLAPLVVATRASTKDHEFAVVAVRPRTTYWLWVGRFAMPSGPPSEPYDVTICGNYFY
jgi:hypothetical protein